MIKNGFAGTTEAAEQLASAQNVRILAVSDTHGEFDLLKKTILRYGPKCDALVFCGDGINDITAYFELAEQDEKIKKALPPAAFFVKGNGDADTYRYNGTVIQIPRYVLFTAAGKKVLVVHGHMYSVDFGIEMLAQAALAHSADIVFYGHTHRPAAEEHNGITFINPGSISRPRGGSDRSCAVAAVAQNEPVSAEFYYVG